VVGAIAVWYSLVAMGHAGYCRGGQWQGLSMFGIITIVP